VEESVWARIAGRTRDRLRAGLRALEGPLAPRFYEGLEELLLAADLGPAVALRLTEAVRKRQPRSLEEARRDLETALRESLSDRPRTLALDGDPGVLLLYGVNGSGKTTTAGKLLHWLKSAGRRPLAVAADTFRAAGIEQLVAWADRAGVPHFAGPPGGDPAAAVFDGIQTARARGCDVVVADTAGRLQTQQNLMEELRKVARVAARAAPGAPHESLLVLDAALGQNSLAQARVFNEKLGLSGLVLAKMDGTARGGAVVAIENELRLPVKLIGLGEGIGDLYAFDPSWYARALFGPEPAAA
jgi:fused signal recognition particle receptor